MSRPENLVAIDSAWSSYYEDIRHFNRLEKELRALFISAPLTNPFTAADSKSEKVKARNKRTELLKSDDLSFWAKAQLKLAAIGSDLLDAFSQPKPRGRVAEGNLIRAGEAEWERMRKRPVRVVGSIARTDCGERLVSVTLKQIETARHLAANTLGASDAAYWSKRIDGIAGPDSDVSLEQLRAINSEVRESISSTALRLGFAARGPNLDLGVPE